MEQRLKQTAEEGDINALYDVIRQDPHILERAEKIPFVDTPLHVAASTGNIHFAMEIMNLKPSFSFTRKLNPDGFSPMHLALLNGHDLVVLWLIDVDESLVRVKGRGGLTALHLAAEMGKCSMLGEFFKSCPQSIQDVTNQGDTALHIALKSNQTEAFQILMGWLLRSKFADAKFWQNELLNWKNDQGNTLLHLAALTDTLEVLIQLLETRNVYSQIKNRYGLTAMNILQQRTQKTESDIRKMQTTKGFFISLLYKCLRYDIPRVETDTAKKLRSKSTVLQSILKHIARATQDISSETRNAQLVVDTLILTATYQAALSPPGGFWQGTDPDVRSSIDIHNSNSTDQPRPSQLIGESVMPSATFELFWLTNTMLFLATGLRVMFILTLKFKRVSSSQVSVIWLFSCYLISMSVVSPVRRYTHTCLVGFYMYIAIVICGLLCWLLARLFHSYMLTPRKPKARSWRLRRPIHERDEWW